MAICTINVIVYIFLGDAETVPNSTLPGGLFIPSILPEILPGIHQGGCIDAHDLLSEILHLGHHLPLRGIWLHILVGAQRVFQLRGQILQPGNDLLFKPLVTLGKPLQESRRVFIGEHTLHGIRNHLVKGFLPADFPPVLLCLSDLIVHQLRNAYAPLPVLLHQCVRKSHIFDA